MDWKVVAVDAMGGDIGLRSTIPAAIEAVKRYDDLQLILVGDQQAIKKALKKYRAPKGEQLIVRHCTEVVAMDESPAVAMRTKKDSSMRVALDLVKAGEAAACVSSGNTGALMACAKFVLKTMDGVSRPAIMASLPTRSGRDVYALDLGANVEASPEQLLQFAIMGSLAVSAIHDKAKPRVGLLNVGTEEIKGNSTVKAAAELLQEIKLFEYGGFVEGDAIFSSSMDVIVCDGFVGNVALKTGEGITKLIGHFAKQEFGRNFLTKIAASVAYPVIKRLVARIDPRVRNGASLLGLNGIVIKSHGRSDALAFRHAIEEARLEVDKQVPALIAEEVARVLAWLDEKNSTTTDVDE